MQDTFLTVEEAARRLAVTPYTLREWLKAGRLHGVQVSKRWRIPERALTELATAPVLPEVSVAVADEAKADEVEAEQPSVQGRRAAVLKARGSMKRPDYPHEVARFLEEKYADETRELATSGAGTGA
jgi:excisionase family DNA binding protein